MKKSLIVIFLCLFMLPVYGGNMSVDKDWDRILDKYESLCESCIQLKLKAEAGEKISKSAFGKLFSSLAELRTELKEGSGSMSEQQRERFASIRARYSAVFGGTQAVAQEQHEDIPGVPERSGPAHPLAKPVVRNDKLIAASKDNTSSQDSGREITSSQDSVREITAAQDSSPQRPEPLPRLYSPEADLQFQYYGTLAECSYHCDVPRDAVPRRVYGSVSFVMAVWSVLSYGGSLSLFDKDTYWGGYLRFHSNFKPVVHSYICSSDSSWDGGTMWPSGNSQISILQASAGVRKNFGPWFGISAGAGYGRKVVLWEDLSGEWAKVQDLSTSNVLLECGLIVDAGPVEIQAGVSTIAFRTISLDFGLGFRF